MAGVKRLRTAAQAVTSDSLTDTPMVVGGPATASAEGDFLDSEGGSVPSDPPVAPVARVEGDLADYEESSS